MKNWILALFALSAVSAYASSDDVLVTCRISGLRTEKDATRTSREDFPYRLEEEKIPMLFESSRGSVQKVIHKIEGTPYSLTYEVSYYPSPNPEYMVLVIEALIRKKDSSGKETLMYKGRDLGRHLDPYDLKTPVHAVVSWENQDITNHLVEAGFSLDEAILIDPSANFASDRTDDTNKQMLDLVQNGTVPNGMLSGLSLGCRVKSPFLN